MRSACEHEKELDLVMPAALWSSLRSHLLPPQDSSTSPSAPDEQLAFILASGNLSEHRRRLLARELLLAGPDDLLLQSPSGIAPRPEFVIAALNRCLNEGLHLVEAHSHPFARGAGTTFSPIDWHNDREKMPAVATIRADMLHATMVLGQESLDAHFYDRTTGHILPLLQVAVVGVHQQHDPGLRFISTASWSDHEQQHTSETNDIETRYQRQELFFGRTAQQRLRRATVVVVGLGGLGSFVALELAHLGIGHLILIDPDQVEETNLNRLLGAGSTDIGQTKVDVYARLVQYISPTTRVDALPCSILDEAAITYAKGADILVGCVDSHGARLILNQIAIRYLIPLVDGGSGIQRGIGQVGVQAGGQVQVILPGMPCLECRDFIDKQQAAFDLATPEHQEQARAHGYGLHKPAPAVVFLNGVIGSLQVNEVMRLLTGSDAQLPYTLSPLSSYDAFSRSLLAVGLAPTTSCITCGETGVLAVGDLDPIRRAVPAEVRSPIPARSRTRRKRRRKKQPSRLERPTSRKNP